jgi:hypothetical protein
MTDTPNPSSAAELLREARVRREWSHEQVSVQTRIPAEMVLALEEKRWNVLPGAPYARAFARTLAVAYELDPEQVLAGLRNDMGEKPAVAAPGPAPLPASDPSPDKVANRTPLILAGIIGLALVLVIAATRLAFQSGPGPSRAPTDSLAPDSVESPAAVSDTLHRHPAPPPPPPPPPAPPRRTVSISSTEPSRTAFFLYIHQGIRKVRKKTLEGVDSMEFDPDTGLLVRNLTGRPLRLSGARHDTLGWSFFKVVRKSDSVHIEKLDEDGWNAVADPILKSKHKKAD